MDFHDIVMSQRHSHALRMADQSERTGLVGGGGGVAVVLKETGTFRQRLYRGAASHQQFERIKT